MSPIKEAELDSWINAYIELVENIEDQIDVWNKETGTKSETGIGYLEY